MLYGATQGRLQHGNPSDRVNSISDLLTALAEPRLCHFQLKALHILFSLYTTFSCPSHLSAGQLFHCPSDVYSGQIHLCMGAHSSTPCSASSFELSRPYPNMHDIEAACLVAQIGGRL